MTLNRIGILYMIGILNQLRYWIELEYSIYLEYETIFSDLEVLEHKKTSEFKLRSELLGTVLATQFHLIHRPRDSSKHPISKITLHR